MKLSYANAFVHVSLGLAALSGLTPSSSEAKVNLLPDHLMNRTGTALSNAIFNEMDNIGLVTLKSDDKELGIEIGRTVFNNGDAEDTFTVVDQLRLPFSIPIVTTPIGGTAFTFNIALGGGAQFTNIRTVKPEPKQNIEDTAELKERRAQVARSEWMKVLRDQGEYIEQQSEDLEETQNRARFGKLWNLVAGPLRLPLRAEWLKHLADYEIVNYGGTGIISVGPSLGLDWEIADTVLKPFEVGAHVRAYLRGDFTITVMKISDTRAKVKVARRHGAGGYFGVGGSTRARLYDGYLVAGLDRRFGKLEYSLVPLQFGQDEFFGKGFDIGYEYDLTDAQGIRAYEAAVLGNFAVSAEIVEKSRLAGVQSPVTEAFSREGNSRIHTSSTAVKLRLFQRNAQSSYLVEEAVITLPDSKVAVFKAQTMSQVQNGYDFFFFSTNRESMRYTIQSGIVQRVDDPSAPPTLGWQAELQVEDNNTSGYELNQYAGMIEGLFGDDAIFPRMPIYLMALDESEKASPKQTRYGPSFFNFRASLNLKQLLRLMNVSDEKMWTYLEAGYSRPKGSWTENHSWFQIDSIDGLFAEGASPLDIAGDVERRYSSKIWSARRFKNRWTAVRTWMWNSGITEDSVLTYEQSKEFMAKLGFLYSDRQFGYELIKTTLFAARDLGEKDVSFLVNAQSGGFPSLSVKGGSFTDIEKLTQEYAKETEFDPRAMRVDTSLEIPLLAIDVNAEGKVKATFSAARNPDMVLIKLDRVSKRWYDYDTARRLLVPNRGQFKEGEQSFTLAKGAEGFEGALAEALEPGQTYRITLALIQGGSTGPAIAREFTVPAATASVR